MAEPSTELVWFEEEGWNESVKAAVAAKIPADAQFSLLIWDTHGNAIQLTNANSNGELYNALVMCLQEMDAHRESWPPAQMGPSRS
jgi:hypothetical protein